MGGGVDVGEGREGMGRLVSVDVGWVNMCGYEYGCLCQTFDKC